MKRLYDLDLLEDEVFGEAGGELPEYAGESGMAGEEWLSSEERASGEEWVPSEEEASSEEWLTGEGLETADDEPPAQLMVTLTLEDGREVSCPAAGIFMENGKEYIALELEGSEILIMALTQGEDDSICLLPLEDSAEREAAFRAFLEIIGIERGEDYDGDQDREEN